MDDLARGDASFAFTPEVIALAMTNIYRKNFNVTTEIEKNIFNATIKTFNAATAEGLSASIEKGAPRPDSDFIYAMKHNNAVFSAFRTHRMQNDMARQLLDDKGKTKSFSQFVKDTQKIRDHNIKQWLRTEYDTAVNRAHQAADWLRFEREKDILPNLEWIPSTSVTPGEDHRIFWGTIAPVDSKFWDEHRPGDRWNCKCGLEATDKNVKPAPNTPETLNKKNAPVRGLENNPGKDAKTINDTHPYFPRSCAACPFGNKNLFAALKNGKKDCYACVKIQSVIESVKNNTIKRELPPKVETYKKVDNRVFVSPYHGKNEVKENIRIAKFVSDKVKDNIYLLPQLDPKTQRELRKKLLPNNVFKDKNADFIIGGKIFEGKSILSIKANDFKGVKTAIENRIKKAKKQADNIILEMPAFIERKHIDIVLKNYLNRTKKQREIWAIWKGKLLKYKTLINQ